MELGQKIPLPESGAGPCPKPGGMGGGGAGDVALSSLCQDVNSKLHLTAMACLASSPGFSRCLQKKGNFRALL